VLDLVSLVLRQEIDWEESLRNDQFLCQVGCKTLTRSMLVDMFMSYRVISESDCWLAGKQTGRGWGCEQHVWGTGSHRDRHDELRPEFVSFDSSHVGRRCTSANAATVWQRVSVTVDCDVVLWWPADCRAVFKQVWKVCTRHCYIHVGGNVVSPSSLPSGVSR